MRKKLIATLALALLCIGAAAANATLYSNSFGTQVLGPNDDSYTGAFNLGFSVNFFGNSFSQIYINNNGNATFGGPTGSYSPAPLNTQTTMPMIAPYWTDLDSRNNGAVYLQQLSGKNIITWNNMGYFPSNYSGSATFQLVLNDPNNVPVGEGSIGFFYGSMSSGNDGHSATAGFGDGLAAVNPGEISVAGGSTSTVASLLDGTHMWFDINDGVPVDTPPSVPEPSTFLLFGAGLAGIAGVRFRRGRG